MSAIRCTGFFLCCAFAAPVSALAQATPADKLNSAQPELIVLRVTLNTEDKGDLFVARTPDGDFLVKIEDLKTIGFREPTGPIVVLDGDPHLSLRSMPGVQFEFQPKGLTLNIMANPHLLPERAITLRGERRLKGAVPRESSAFFNYAINYRHGASAASSDVGFAAEAGWRRGEWLILSDGSTAQDRSAKFVRLGSSITHDDRDTLSRVILGDFFTPAREFGNGVNLGGLSVSKVYSLDPYLVAFPTKNITGNVALPTDLEVYLDGQRIRTERLRPGEFELRDILAYGGSRNVQLVLRDSFGRVQQLNYSFYFSDQPLQEGFHEYSYNAGAMRRNFGTQSANYGPLAYSAYHRYGLTNAITVGLRTEGTKRLTGVGSSATLVLGNAGVVNLAMAGSSVEGRQGSAGSIGYNYQAPLWNMGVSVRRDWGEYATLGLPITTSNRKYEATLGIAINLPWRGSLSFSQSALVTRIEQPNTPVPADSVVSFVPLEKRRVSTITYAAPFLSEQVSLTATLSHIKENAQIRNETFLGLIYFPDKDHSVQASYRGDKANNAQALLFSKNQPIGEGLGYVLSADRSSGGEAATWFGKSSVQYNAAAAILRGEYGVRREGTTSVADYRLSAAGGVAYAGGHFALGRPVVDSFGIVKVGEIPDVTVLVNNQEMGKTNAQGKLFIPTLSPYFDNDVSIAPSTVPIDFSIPATSRKVSPSSRGGALIDFGVTKVQAFSGTLVALTGGSAVPVQNTEATLTYEGKPRRFLIGRAGEFYLENLQPGSYAATVQVDGKVCAFELKIPPFEEMFVELGETVCHPQP